MRLNTRFDNMLLTLLISIELLLELCFLYYYYNVLSDSVYDEDYQDPNLVPGHLLLPKEFTGGGISGAMAGGFAASMVAQPKPTEPPPKVNIQVPQMAAPVLPYGAPKPVNLAALKPQQGSLPGGEIPKIDESANTECPADIHLVPNERIPLTKNTKFLLPIVKWGPNNQILGFYEAMHLSNYLGTKLVLPPFYFHESDFKRNKELQTVIGEIRVNAEGIDNLVNMNDYVEHCGDQPEAVLLATDVLSGSLPGRILKFQEVTGQRVIYKPQGTKFYKFYDNIAQFPRVEEIQKRYAEGDNFVRQTWRETFKNAANDYKCLMFVLPFRTIIKPPRELWAAQPAYEYSPIVKEIANSFIEKFGGNIKLGAHWRYNKGEETIKIFFLWGFVLLQKKYPRKSIR